MNEFKEKQMDGKEENDGFGVWGILELMGHIKVSGFITEQELFGTKVGRIDIPAGNGETAVTQYFGGQALFRLTPTTEGIARAFAEKARPRPVQRFELTLAPGMATEYGGWDDESTDEDIDF